MFKKILLITTIVAAPAYAGNVDGYVEDHYKTVTRQQPYTQQVCQEVTIQEQRQEGNAGGVILGAIVGNAIGAATGIGDARTLGTVIGGIAGNEMSKNQHSHGDGYHVEQRCRDVTRYTSYQEERYSHSTITFYRDGRRYTLRFKK